MIESDGRPLKCIRQAWAIQIRIVNIQYTFLQRNVTVLKYFRDHAICISWLTIMQTQLLQSKRRHNVETICVVQTRKRRYVMASVRRKSVAQKTGPQQILEKNCAGSELQQKEICTNSTTVALSSPLLFTVILATIWLNSDNVQPFTENNAGFRGGEGFPAKSFCNIT